jgi:hypothetical protein
MKNQETNGEADVASALAALVWTISDPARADRLLALTGLDSDSLRSGLGDRALLAAILRFLEAHEPDLIACAEAIGTSPAELVATRRRLET